MSLRLRYPALALPAFLFCLGSAAAVAAEGFEQHAVHEHGKITLNIVLESTRLTVEFDSPAVNVVGFEHAPRTKEEVAAVATANGYLKDARSLFGFPPGAGCRATNSRLTPPHWEEDSAAGHDEHEEHEEHEHHAGYEASFEFQCSAPEKLSWLEPWLLGRLRNVTEARVNTITAAGQRSVVVTHARARIALR